MNCYLWTHTWVAQGVSKEGVGLLTTFKAKAGNKQSLESYSESLPLLSAARAVGGAGGVSAGDMHYGSEHHSQQQ